VALPVLAATLTTVVVFFPVTFLYGVSKYLFSALALAVALSLFASFAVAMTVVPLFCARFIKDFGAPWNAVLEQPVTVDHVVKKPKPSRTASISGSTTASRASSRSTTAGGIATRPPPVSRWRALAFCASPAFVLFPQLGLSFFPRTDAGQFVINLKAPIRHAPQRYGE
jgi:multidrug efflux pump subunit AcrB